MARFGAKKTSGGRNIYLSVIIFLLLIFLFLSAIHSLSSGSLEEQQKNLEQALTQGAVHCYAVEGSYPENLEQLCPVTTSFMMNPVFSSIIRQRGRI